MMQLNDNRFYYTICAISTGAIGTLLRLLYRLYPSAICAIFSPTNSSVFEELKTLFWPVILFMLIHEFLFRSGDFERHTLYLFCALVFLTVTIYTYSGILGYRVTVVDMILFYVTVASFFLFSIFTRYLNRTKSVFSIISAPITMIVLITVFVAFTFNPPEIGFFRDPDSGTYGLQSH